MHRYGVTRSEGKKGGAGNHAGSNSSNNGNYEDCKLQRVSKEEMRKEAGGMVVVLEKKGNLRRLLLRL